MRSRRPPPSTIGSASCHRPTSSSSQPAISPARTGGGGAGGGGHRACLSAVGGLWKRGCRRVFGPLGGRQEILIGQTLRGKGRDGVRGGASRTAQSLQPPCREQSSSCRPSDFSVCTRWLFPSLTMKTNRRDGMDAWGCSGLNGSNGEPVVCRGNRSECLQCAYLIRRAGAAAAPAGWGGRPQ